MKCTSIGTTIVAIRVKNARMTKMFDVLGARSTFSDAVLGIPVAFGGEDYVVWVILRPGILCSSSDIRPSSSNSSTPLNESYDSVVALASSTSRDIPRSESAESYVFFGKDLKDICCCLTEVHVTSLLLVSVDYDDNGGALFPATTDSTPCLLIWQSLPTIFFVIFTPQYPPSNDEPTIPIG